MPSINLDERLNLDTKVNVTVAEKEYSLVLNDELSVKISDVQLELSKRIEDLTDMPEEKFKEMSLEERKKLVVDTMHDGREDIFKAMDRIFGTGEGKRIYDYYNQSTRAISKIIAAIDDVLNDKLQTNKNRKERRAEKYTKKRRG